MKLPVDLATASREELLHLIGQLLSRIEALEARIAELEGQSFSGRTATGCPGGEETTLLGQTLPTSPPQAGTQEAGPRLRPTARGADPSGPSGEGRFGPMPRLSYAADRWASKGASPGDHPTTHPGAGDRTRGAGTYLPKVPEGVVAQTRFECHHGGSATGGHLGAERSECAQGGVSPPPLK